MLAVWNLDICPLVTAYLSMPQYGVEDLPEDIRELRIQELNDLIGSRKALFGLRDALPVARQRHEEYADRARENKVQVKRILSSQRSLKDLENEISELATSEQDRYQTWVAAESQMYSKSRPYTSVGIEASVRSRLDNHRRTAQELSRRVASEAEDLPALVKRYAEELKNVYYYEELLKAV